MATPLVAGIASLLLSRKPTWTPDQLRARLQSTCDNIESYNPGFAGLIGSGRINAARALGLEEYGLGVGCAADLVVLEAASPSDAIVSQAEKRYVFKQGRLVASSRVLREQLP